uniref:Uncharacterized protein n=1 Tax=Oryza barthii TaxID=65489 RepID=A0A0D3EXP4_9ORYZ
MWELLFWDLLGREKKKMKKRRELLKIRGNLTAEANHGRYMCMAVAPLKLKENSIAPWIIHRTDFLRKMHSHVICDLQEEGQRLDFYVEEKELISEVSVPGSESTLRISTEVCRAVLFKIIKRFQSMHSAGFSLGGFEHKILFVTSDFEVKIGGISRVKDFTKTRGSKDYKSIGKIAREVIFSSVTNLPVDIEQLLDLLTDNPMEQTALLGMHYSLLDPLTQVSEFLWWHKRLIHLKDINPEKFQRIMENIPTGNNWMSRAVENKYIRKVSLGIPKRRKGLVHTTEEVKPETTAASQGTGIEGVKPKTAVGQDTNIEDPKPETATPKCKYSEDSWGQSLLCRNSIEHLDRWAALRRIKKKKSGGKIRTVKVQFEEMGRCYIIIQAFSKFFGELQKALAEENELPQRKQ